MLVAQNSLGPVCPVPLTVRGTSLKFSLLTTMTMYCFGIQGLAAACGFVTFVFTLAQMVGLTNHYFQHGRSKQRLPKLIRKYVFKGFLWKYNIFVDDMFHKKHHLDGEDNFAISVGFMDKLVYKLKLGQTLYMHNPKLNYAMFDLYFLLMGAFQVLCTRATSNLLNS